MLLAFDTSSAAVTVALATPDGEIAASSTTVDALRHGELLAPAIATALQTAGVTPRELTGIAVLPSARNRGVGAAITAALVADARSRGVDTVFLSAGTERVAAIYARVGFIPVATACIAEDESG